MPPEDQVISAAEEYLIKGSNTKESVLPETSIILNDSGREGDKGSNGVMDECMIKDNSSDESEWEVSDFMSSEDSCDEWLP